MDTKRIRDLMTKSPSCVRDTDTVLMAAQKMRDCKCGGLPVCDRDRKPIGFITDRDVTIRCVAEGHNAAQCTVDHCMTRGTMMVKEDADMMTACDMMKEKQIRRIMVVDKDGKLTGMLSMAMMVHNMEHDKAGDLVCAITMEKGQTCPRGREMAH